MSIIHALGDPCVGASTWKAADENHSEGGFDQLYKFHKDSKITHVSAKALLLFSFSECCDEAEGVAAVRGSRTGEQEADPNLALG
jgi:hypothetical protein